MKIVNRSINIILVLGAMLISGCGDQSPSEDAVEAASVAYYQEHMLDALADPGYRGIDIRIAAQKVEEIRVNNRYSKKIDGDTFHVYDIEVAVKLGNTKYRETISLALVKRGEEWKWTQIGKAKTKPVNLDENPELKARQAESDRLQEMFDTQYDPAAAERKAKVKAMRASQ